MVDHDGFGWVGKGGQYYRTAERARASFWPDAEEIFSDGSITREHALAPEPPSIIVLPPVICSVTQYVNATIWHAIRKDPEGLFRLTPREFEELVAELFHREGFDVTITPQTHDGGRDIIAVRRDGVGSFRYLAECKRYARGYKVGVALVRSLYGVLEDDLATAALLATTSSFTSDAEEFAARHEWRLKLKDYIALKEWLAKHQ